MKLEPRYKHLDNLINVFVIVLIISNLVTSKIVAIGTFRLSGAQLLFPITYIFGDIFTEVYGYAASRRAIWTGFLASALLAAMGLIVVALPPAPEWHDQEAFAKVFHFVPRVVIASLIAYWCREFANAFVMARVKLLCKEKCCGSEPSAPRLSANSSIPSLSYFSPSVARATWAPSAISSLPVM